MVWTRLDLLQSREVEQSRWRYWKLVEARDEGCGMIFYKSDCNSKDFLSLFLSECLMSWNIYNLWKDFFLLNLELRYGMPIALEARLAAVYVHLSIVDSAGDDYIPDYVWTSKGIEKRHGMMIWGRLNKSDKCSVLLGSPRTSTSWLDQNWLNRLWQAQSRSFSALGLINHLWNSKLEKEEEDWIKR